MNPNERINVLIAESLPQVAKQLQKLFNIMDTVEIVSQVKTAQEALEAIKETKPEVALIDINLSDMNGIDLTEIIRREYPMTQVVVISQDKYYDTVLRAMRNGASDFITHDVTLEELNVAIKRAGEIAHTEKMKLHPYQQYGESRLIQPDEEEASGPLGNIITVFSPKGGTGVSTIAINLAIALQNSESTVAVVDSSVQFGDVAILLNEIGKFSIIDLVPRIYELDTKVIDDVMLIHKPSGLRILMAPPRPELAEKVSGNNMVKILELMRQMFNYIVVNTSSFISDPCLAALDASDVLILVTTQEIAAIRCTRSFLELWDGLGLPKDRIMLAINRYNKQKSIPIEKISESLKFPVTLTIPSDEETLVRAANLGTPFMLGKKVSPVTESISSLADLVLKRLPEVEIQGRFRLFSLV